MRNRLLIGLIVIALKTVGQLSLNAQHVCLNKDEQRLAGLINSFRQRHKLPELVLSRSLSYVAQLHVRDLQTNRPDTSICSTASWSDKGNWNPCCFTALAPNFDCIWNKPRELTEYNFRGYEISHYEEGIIHVDSLFSLWTKTPQVVDMLLGRNAHSDKKWVVMGLAVGENYASLWLGQRADAAGRPDNCDQLSASDIQLDDSPLKRIDTKPGTYHLIFASFSNKSDANEAVRRFRNAGFTKAAVIVREGRYRVSIDKFNNLKDAMSAREKLLIDYPEVWIFKE